MRQFQVIEAKPFHCGQIARRLRKEHRAPLLSLGIDPHRELASAFSRSSYRWAWTVDGRVSGIGGVIGSLASPEGFVWLALAEDARGFRKAIVRGAKEYLGKLLETHTKLTTTILCGDVTARRFASFLGFRRSNADTVAGAQVMEIERAAYEFGETDVIERPFVVFGLPRSRTTWLSAFLSYGKWTSSHDLPVQISSLAELYAELGKPNTGTVETGLAAGWRAIRQKFPNARFVVVRRPIDDVRRSAGAHGWDFPEGYLELQEAFLDEISAQRDTLTVWFDELDQEETCASVFEHCLGAPFDRRWWLHMREKNIQLDMDVRLGLLMKRAETIGDLFAEIDRTVIIQEDDCETFLADGADLFKQHAAQAGETEGLPYDPDYDMARNLARAGLFLAVTARTPTRMVGYIVFIMTPSLESRGVMVGHQNVFFVDAGQRGRLGIRLHAEARRLLKERGVNFLILRSGIKASAERQERLFERLGAKPYGKLFTLRMGA